MSIEPLLQSHRDLELSADRSWRSLFPFRSHFMQLDKARMHYVDEGQGPTILMVHGNPTWSFMWRDLIGALRDEHRVVAVDHVGCGLSDKPHHYPYRLSQHVDNLGHLVDHLDLREITLMVHDWGGPIGLGAIMHRPDRLGRLVFFNTGAFAPPFIPWRIGICRTPLLGTLAIRGLNLFSRAAMRMTTVRRLVPDVRAGYLAPYDSWANRVAVDRFVRDIPFSRRHSTWKQLEGIEAGLGSLAHLPALMVWGMRDWCFRPACLQRLVQWFPQARVVQMQDAAHLVIEDATDRVVTALRSFFGDYPL